MKPFCFGLQDNKTGKYYSTPDMFIKECVKKGLLHDKYQEPFRFALTSTGSVIIFDGLGKGIYVLDPTRFEIVKQS